MTILHIEDDLHIQKIVKSMLEHAGYQVTSCSTAEEGLTFARQLLPSMILMDMWLPSGMDGWEATRQIKANPDLAHIHVVAITAQKSANAEQQAYELGCSAYLAKPFEMYQLISCVESLLEAH
jgi:CheY-like chemotaxis protein